jgi:SAM-dependent methyltransferase
MVIDYADVFQSDDAVSKYEDVQYAPHTQPWEVNERQRAYLRALIARRFPDPPVQHDFACGTGRAIDLLAGHVSVAYGYDVSAAMMARARALGRQAQWHRVAAEGPVPWPASVGGPSVVTVFRLLLNVPVEVRDRAVAFAATVLPDAGSGLLVVQNHGSRRSLRHLARRRHRSNEWFQELSDAEVESSLARYGFEVVERRGFALFPQGWYGPARLRPLIRRVDAALCATRLFDRWAVDVLYVARRVG